METQGNHREQSGSARTSDTTRNSLLSPIDLIPGPLHGTLDTVSSASSMLMEL